MNVRAPPSETRILLVDTRLEPDVRSRAHIEFFRIISRIRGTANAPLFEFVQLPEARFIDVRSALIARDPHVFHIVGQGMTDGSLRFESDDGRHEIVSASQLLRLLGAFRDSLRFVFFNIPNSAHLARKAQRIVGSSLGISDALPDADAIDFAVAFYEAYAYGYGIDTAFDIARASLKDDLVKRPVLFSPKSCENQRSRPR